jgi:hypothetical protein
MKSTPLKIWVFAIGLALWLAVAAGDWRWRIAFLKAIGAGYVWYDEYLKARGDWNPNTVTCLQPVYASQRVSIYRVQQP